MLGIETLDCTRAQVATGTVGWFDEEIVGCKFKDLRLARRVRSCSNKSAMRLVGASPLACEDWTNTKAAYRFLSNERVNEADILSGHLQATRERFANSAGYVFVLHDTGRRKSYVAGEMKRVKISGPHRIHVRDADGKPDS